MKKTFRYFQPEYVSKFQCDASKCGAHCCKGWKIEIDQKSCEQYSNIEPPETSKEILSCMEFDSEKKNYVMKLKPNGFCPMLTEKNLCRLQADYGENFLSQMCATYPRITHVFGDFFERSLALSCPVAAEMILFSQEPIKFLFVDVDEKTHSNGGKIIANSFSSQKFLADELFAIQGTMLSILQERRLSINQRLTVLALFVKELEELVTVEVPSPKDAFALRHTLRKLVSSYNPKVFLRDIIPPALQEISFDAEKFIMLMISFFSPIYVDAAKISGFERKYFDAVIDILRMNPADNHRLTYAQIAANYMALADERKFFSDTYSIFLENYLVNEFFSNICPWKFEGGMVKNFFVFLISYKIFELMIFSASLKGFDKKVDVLVIVNQFTREIDHNQELQKKILEFLKDGTDYLELTESLLEN